MTSSLFHAFSDHGAPQGETFTAPQGPFFSIDPPDVAERLPSAAKGHLASLRDHVEALYEIVERLNVKRQESWAARGEADLYLQQLTDPAVAMRYSRTHVFGEDHPDSVTAKAKLDKAARVAREISDRYDLAADRWTKQKRLLSKIEGYIAAARNLTMAPAVKLKFPTVDRLAAEVERIRKDIAELQAEKHAINSAAFPAAEAKARARAEIEMLAERGKPRVTQLIDHGPAAGVGWPHLVAKSSIYGMKTPLPGDEALTADDLPGAHLALIAWLHKDQLIAALDVEITAVAEDDAALSTEQRAVKLAEVDARILDAERIECALVRNAGGTIDFRENTDPRAVLGVDGPAPRED